MASAEKAIGGNHPETVYFFIVPFVLASLYITALVDYLLFHSLVEIFSIVVASCIFVISWNLRDYIKNSFLLFIGIAYLFIGILDLLHTLSYKGMPIFADYDFYANQLWIGARFMESLSLLLGFLFLGRFRKINAHGVLLSYALLTIFLILSVFYWKIFPECFAEGTGLTPFKKISEYVICFILLVNIHLLRQNRTKFENRVYLLIFYSIICTIISELAFTFYVSNYGLSNLVGHYFKLFSFYLVYRAIVETCLKKPYELIFRELDISNKKLSREVQTRVKTEQEREKLIDDLRKALSQIKTLKGLLPICSHCKKIRDDKGYWNTIESYISSHSLAEFSHSICGECIEKYYPDTDTTV